MPIISSAVWRACSGLFTTLMPPALPRPPAWTCAFTTTVPPMSRAACSASAAVVTKRPGGTSIPYSRSSALAWYSWTFIGGLQLRRGDERLHRFRTLVEERLLARVELELEHALDAVRADHD